MSAAADYFLLQSTTMDPCTFVREDHEVAARGWLCTGCGAPKPDVRSIDVKIQETRPADTPLNFVSGSKLGIARVEFLQELGVEAVQNELYLGKVRDESGRALEPWVTFRGRHHVIVRGSRNVSYRKCDRCGRHVYFAMGKPYLFPAPPPGIRLIDAGTGGLVVTAELLHRVRLNRWKELTFVLLPVATKPRDSLPALT